MSEKSAPTVLTIEPLDYNAFGNTMVHQFGGSVTSGKNVIQVKYPASLAAHSIERGVTALNELLHSTPGEVLVFAHSQGAQVVSRWLRGHAATGDAPDPYRISFLLIGNLLRKYGGNGVGTKEVDGLIALPTPNDTRYRVVDVKLQYDGWADKPTKPRLWANLNALKGKFAIHSLGYRKANLNDPGRKQYQENSTLYVMLPHAPAVRCPQRWIERAYSRPEG